MTSVDRRKYNEIVAEVRKDFIEKASLVDSTPERINQMLDAKQETILELAYDEWLRWKCLNDLYFLGAVVLGWQDAVDIKTRRKRIDPKIHAWMAWQLQQDCDKMLLLPRGILKSTWTKLRIVQRILNNPNIRICLCSVTSTLVETELADIKNIFATPILRRLFPDIIPDPGKDYKNWEKSNAECLTLKRNPELGFVPQEAQVTVVGQGKKITGHHFDEIYFDDVIDKDSVTTIEQMQKVMDWYGYMQSIMDPAGTMTIIGTFYHYNDLYNTIIREEHIDKNHICIRRVRENGKIIYSYFTEKYLERMLKRQGRYIFNCQYNLDPSPVEDKIFAPPIPTYIELPKGQEYAYYITVDPAPTVNSYSDTTGVVIAALDKSGFIWIVESIGFKKKPNELADFIIKKCLQYRPTQVGIELGLQESFQYLLDMKIQEYEHVNKVKVPCNVLPIPISRTKSKGDRINLTMGAFVREGKLSVHKSCTGLIQQMEMFTGKDGDTDDQVDAASMLFYTIEKFSMQYWKEPLFSKKKSYELTLEEKLNGKRKSKVWENYFQSGEAA
jgi:hypothetical protein